MTRRSLLHNRRQLCGSRRRLLLHKGLLVVYLKLYSCQFFINPFQLLSSDLRLELFCFQGVVEGLYSRGARHFSHHDLTLLLNQVIHLVHVNAGSSALPVEVIFYFALLCTFLLHQSLLLFNPCLNFAKRDGLCLHFLVHFFKFICDLSQTPHYDLVLVVAVFKCDHVLLSPLL